MPLTIRNERGKDDSMPFTKKWRIAVVVRMIKTFAEGALTVIGTQAIFINEVNWLAVLSGGAMAAAVSFLLALKGLPEA